MHNKIILITSLVVCSVFSVNAFADAPTADAPLPTNNKQSAPRPAGPQAAPIIQKDVEPVGATKSAVWNSLSLPPNSDPAITKPHEIELKLGDSINLIQPWARDPGVFEESLYHATVVSTDGNPDDVVAADPQAKLNLGSKTEGITVFQLGRWTSKRVGTAEIRFVGPSGQEGNMRRIKVTVVAPKKSKSQNVDLGKALPKQLTLEVGDSIVFENGSATITVKDTDGQGQLLDSRPHNTFNQAAAFQAKRPGTGEIKVVFPAQGQLTVTRTATIGVTVQASSSNAKTTKLNASSNGKTVGLKKGESLDICLTGKVSTGAAWSVDKVDGDSIELASEVEYSDLDPNTEGGNTLYTLHFKISKNGKSTINLKYSRGGNEPSWQTYSVTIDVVDKLPTQHDLIVGWSKAKTDAEATAALSKYKVTKLEAGDNGDSHNVVIESDATEEEILSELEKLPDVRFAEPNSEITSD